MKPYYYVLNKNRTDAPTLKHETLAEAVAEAERLACKHPGHSLEVLQCIAIARIPTPPPCTFYMDGFQPTKTYHTAPF